MWQMHDRNGQFGRKCNYGSCLVRLQIMWQMAIGADRIGQFDRRNSSFRVADVS